MNLSAVTAIISIYKKPSLDTEIFWAMFTWVLPAICAFGVVTNLINIIIFCKKDLKEDIYSYMLAYSVSDFFYTFFVFFTWISRSRYPIASTYLAKWYEIYMFFTALNGLGTMSALAELAISFDRILLIRRSKLSGKFNAGLVIFLMFLVSLGTAVVYCAVRGIRQVESLTFYPEFNVTRNVTSYVIFFNSFGVSLEGQILYVVVTVVKNIGTLIVMIIVNVMLIFEMKNFWNRKLKITNISKAGVSNQTMETTDETVDVRNKGVVKQVKTQQAAKVALKDEQFHKLLKMVISLFVLYIIGNLTNAIIGVCFIFYSDQTFFNMLLTFGDVPQFLCRGLNIFVYYKFNNRFRDIFNSHADKFKCW